MHDATSGDPERASLETRSVGAPVRSGFFVYVTLVRHFLNRLIHIDAFQALPGSTDATAQILALIAAPGIVLPFLLLMKYFYLYTTAPAAIPAEIWKDRCFFVSYSLATIGIVSTLQWDALTLNRRDRNILGPLPIHPTIICLALPTAQMIFLSCFFLAANLPAAILLPMAFGLASPEASGAAMTGAFMVTGGVVFLTVFPGLVVLRGILRSILNETWFQRISPWIQAGLVIGFTLVFFLSSTIAQSLPYLEKNGGPFPIRIPTLWFTGLHETLLGGRGPLVCALGRLAVTACWATAACFLLQTAAGFFRFFRGWENESDQEGASVSRKPSRLGQGPARWFLRDPRERAVFSFILQTAVRAPQAHLIWTASFALAAALSLAQLCWNTAGNSPESIPVLAIPFTFTFCLLLGFRYSATRPVDLEANWLFRLTQPEASPALIRGIRKAGWVVAILPPTAASFLVHGLLGGWKAASLHHAFVLLAALALQELLFWNFPKIPFTCEARPGKANLKLTWPLYALAFSVYTQDFASLSGWMRQDIARYLALCVPFPVLVCILRHRQHQRLSRGLSHHFTEEAEPAVQQLSLSE